MPDKEQVRETATQPMADSKMHPVESQRLIALGFDPLAPVYDATRGYSEEAITQALFYGLRHERKTVDFQVELRNGDCVLPMEIELLQVVFVTEFDHETGQPDHFNNPAWYLRGHLGRCDINPNGEVIRMYAYTHELAEGELSAYLQIVREVPVKIPALSLDGCLTESFGRPSIATPVGY
jgi:hypothetical protein